MKKLTIICLAALPALVSCENREELFETKRTVQYITKERVIDTRELTVPEESGVRFTQFSTETDNLYTPYIENKQGVIYWDTDPKIGISPDGMKVAYVGIANGKSNIYIKSTQGGKTTIQRTFKENIVNVSYSPDGEKLVYTERLDSDKNIFQIDANQGASVQQISSTSQIERTPIYSSDNNFIFFSKGEYSASTKSYRYYIWNFDRKTSIMSQFCEGFSPSISPDSKTLYFTRNNKSSGLGEIWSLNLITGQETQILSDSERGFSSPKISPDGKTLVITGSTLATSSRIENLDLYTINTNGTNLTQVTFHPGHDLSPTWGPKGKLIYFLSQRGNEKGTFGIWSIEYKN
ncbi:MAG: hypothetical protein N4A41_08360 [Crocinitomicaceae bacterium]|jgi:Tol biopolymer transport system component|nr:hypothetical protein [Crocinitomicaceae bacterium]